MGTGGNQDTGGTAQEERPRRNFLKYVVTVGVLVVIGSLSSSLRLLGFVPSSASQATKSASWPRVKIANISAIGTEPVLFNYPLVDTPNVLLKVGVRAENGVGPNSDIVAFSTVCQHLGCIYGVVRPGSSPPCNPSHTAQNVEGYCCCHGGEYDLTRGALVIGGPPPRAVPPVILEYDNSNGDIYAVGMGPPTIFGHGPAGTTDPASVLKYDLEGGEVVTQATVLSGG